MVGFREIFFTLSEFCSRKFLALKILSRSKVYLFLYLVKRKSQLIITVSAYRK